MSHHIPDVTKMISDTPRMKAAQMAAIEHGTGDVWRVGCDIERELNAANDRIKRLAGKIDRVLVDAPCSGLGTLRRSPDLKWRQTPATVAAQAELLNVRRDLRAGEQLQLELATAKAGPSTQKEDEGKEAKRKKARKRLFIYLVNVAERINKSYLKFKVQFG